MLVDHAGRYLGLVVPAWQFVGRFAFVLYAVSFGIQCGRAGAAPGAPRRLLTWGLLVAPVFLVVTRESRLDVLCTLGLAAYAVGALAWSGWRRVVALGLCAVAAQCCEYGVFGALVVVATSGLVVSRRGNRVAWAVLLAFAVCALAPREGLGFVVGFLIAAILVRWGPRVPRVRRLFLGAYVVQWPALLVARALW
jgi:hypothetical protein